MASASTIKLITDPLTKMGLTNSFVQQGIVGVIGEESSYVPKAELSYRNTPASRLRFIFGDKLKPFTDAQLDLYKKDDIAFFDIVYGGQYGNTARGDGFKYRGRGFNQITFKNLYKQYGDMIGVDLVNNPDRLNEVPIAAAAAAAYFVNTINTAKANGSLQTKIGVSDLSQVKDLQTGAKVALQANAGFGKNLNTDFFQGVLAKVMSNITANPLTTSIAVGSFVILGLITFFFLNTTSKK